MCLGKVFTTEETEIELNKYKNKKLIKGYKTIMLGSNDSFGKQKLSSLFR